MNTPADDSKIRQLFESLREEEMRGLPAFRSVIAESSGNRSAWRSHPLLRAAALVSAAVLIAGPAVYIAWSGESEPSAAEMAALFDWEAPTDFLLEADENELISDLPSLETEAEFWDESADISE